MENTDARTHNQRMLRSKEEYVDTRPAPGYQTGAGSSDVCVLRANPESTLEISELYHLKVEHDV